MHLEDAFASTDVREWDHDLPVEPPRSQESGIKDVGPVAGRNENDAIIRLESVHLDQQLVQCLLTLVVTSAKTGATMPSHSIDLVDENDAGSILFSLLEEVADPAGSNADEHLHEIGSADGKEGNVGFTRDSARQKGLSGTGRSHKEHAFGDPSPEFLEFLGLL